MTELLNEKEQYFGRMECRMYLLDVLEVEENEMNTLINTAYFLESSDPQASGSRDAEIKLTGCIITRVGCFGERLKNYPLNNIIILIIFHLRQRHYNYILYYKLYCTLKKKEITILIFCTKLRLPNF